VGASAEAGVLAAADLEAEEQADRIAIMNGLYYFDTSIWLDFLEERDEPNMPKSTWAKELVRTVIENEDKILLSEWIMNEMIELGMSKHDIEEKFNSLRNILIIVYSTKKQFGKAKDLSKKRGVPIRDALHSLIARDNRAIMVTRDRHFNQLSDIIKYKKPEELI
jgi:predicted nucleic acid-binding protein